MKAAFTDGNRQIEIRNVSEPIPGEGEVLLKIEASGICGSDLVAPGPHWIRHRNAHWP